MTSPEKNGWRSRATGYFAPNMTAYETPEMKEFLANNPDAKSASISSHLPSPGSPPIRPSRGDEVQAAFAGKKQPALRGAIGGFGA
jgi:sn-glycerol 3-phosphate transport system substrate-binding protein